MWRTQLDVHPNVVRKAAHEQLGLLDGVEVPRMAQHRVEAVGVCNILEFSPEC
jgi:hypothetical protein